MVPLQALPFLDTKVYPVLQAVDVVNMVQPVSAVSYVETTKKGKQQGRTQDFSKRGL